MTLSGLAEDAFEFFYATVPEQTPSRVLFTSRQAHKGFGSTRTQIVGLGGAAIFPWTGVMVTLLGERNQVDVQTPDAWTAGTILINWFPYAHVELQLMERLQFPSGGSAASTLFFQVHYFL